jgi:hypothetical protein
MDGDSMGTIFTRFWTAYKMNAKLGGRGFPSLRLQVSF